MISAVWYTLAERIRAIFHRQPWVAEFGAGWAGLAWITLVHLRGQSGVLPPSFESLGGAAALWIWYSIAFVGLWMQITGLLIANRWLRWSAAVLLSGWWLTVAWALILAPWGSWLPNPTVALYLMLAGFNAYAVVHLLWEDV